MAYIVSLFKQRGETPLECVERFKKTVPEIGDEPLSYLGRLDPLAEGVLLVSVGFDEKLRNDVISYDKKYEVEILCGVETDTYDPLGRVVKASTLNIDEQKMRDALITVCNRTMFPYPPFSSKSVRGKPLFQWAREGRLNEIEIPYREMSVKEVSVIGYQAIGAMELFRTVNNLTGLVKGDFRQKEIIDSWRISVQALHHEFSILTARFTVSSGTYVRTIAHELGKTVGAGAIAYRITRTAAGPYSIHDSKK